MTMNLACKTSVPVLLDVLKTVLYISAPVLTLCFSRYSRFSRWSWFSRFSWLFFRYTRYSRHSRYFEISQHPFKRFLLCVFLSCKLHQSSAVWTNQKKKQKTYGVQMMCQVYNQGDFQLTSRSSLCRKKTKKCDNMTLIFHLYAYKTFLYLSIICQFKINDFLSRQS